jgi:hypothetical protein
LASLKKIDQRKKTAVFNNNKKKVNQRKKNTSPKGESGSTKEEKVDPLRR